MEKYVKVRSLQKGPLRHTFLAQDPTTGRLHCVAVAPLGRLTAAEAAGAVREAELLATLRHANVVQFVEAFCSSGKDQLSVVTEYTSEGDLNSKLGQYKAQGMRVEEGELLDWLIQMCCAVGYIHEKQIVHRNLKPRSFAVAANGILKLQNFDLSCVMAGEPMVADVLVGTPFYLSPEIIEHHQYSDQSDMWALGITVFYLAAHRLPFHSDSVQDLLMHILMGKYSPIPPTYSAGLRDLLDDLLRRELTCRPTASQALRYPVVQDRLQSWKEGDPDVTVCPEYARQVVRGEHLPGSAAGPHAVLGRRRSSDGSQWSQSVGPTEDGPREADSVEDDADEEPLPEILPTGGPEDGKVLDDIEEVICMVDSGGEEEASASGWERPRSDSLPVVHDPPEEPSRRNSAPPSVNEAWTPKDRSPIPPLGRPRLHPSKSAPRLVGPASPRPMLCQGPLRPRRGSVLTLLHNAELDGARLANARRKSAPLLVPLELLCLRETSEALQPLEPAPLEPLPSADTPIHRVRSQRRSSAPVLTRCDFGPTEGSPQGAGCPKGDAIGLPSFEEGYVFGRSPVTTKAAGPGLADSADQCKLPGGQKRPLVRVLRRSTSFGHQGTTLLDVQTP
eukprot:EG_transcript_2567